MDVPNAMYPSYIPDDPEEEKKKRALAATAIVDAGKRGQEISDAGGVPLFTNVPQDKPTAETVYVPQQTMQDYNPIPKKPTDLELSVSAKLAEIKKNVIADMFKGTDPNEIDPTYEGNSAAKAFIEKNKGRMGEVTPKLLEQAQKVGEQEYVKKAQEKQQMLGQFQMFMGMAEKEITKREAEIQEQKKYNRTQKEKEKDSFKNWEPEAKEIAIKTKMITGKDPLNVSNRDWQERRIFNDEYYKYIKEKGLTANDVVVMQATYKSGSSSLGNMKKQEAPMRAFVNNINTQVDYAKELFDGLKRTDFRLLNLPLRELRTRVAGSGLERQYELFLQEISMEANKLAQGSSASIAQLPEGNRKEWLRIHDINLPLKEILPVLEGTKKMANMRLSTWLDSTNYLIKEMGAIGESPVNTNPGGIDMDAIAAELKRRKGK
ncbi:MAG: hypothetical protein WC332_00885 [Clostridia bacterium]|jgi:hypothetical protein